VAIPKLLALLDLHGATVTIDAMGCQKAIAQQIIEGGGDYVLAVKENQPSLHRTIQVELDDMIRNAFAGVRHDHQQTVEGDHGRIETRDVWTTDQLDWLKLVEDWPGLRSIIAVESKREVIGGSTSVERRYYITSRAAKAGDLAKCVRGHWGIENRLHYVLDVSFSEDQARQRTGYSAENFARLRRIALNLLQREKKLKRGIKGKRLNAAWDHDYLLKILSG
jgi:predicted transposase YbfD/YdcC